MKPSLRLLGTFVLAAGLFVSCSGKKESGNKSGAENPPAQVKTETPRTEKAPKAEIDSEGKGESVREELQSLMDLVAAGKTEEMLFAYKGEDPDRVWKEPYNHELPAEKTEIQKMAAQLEVIFTGMSDIKFESFQMEEESEGVWHVWLTRISYEDGNQEEVAFAFLPLGDRFMLGDID